VAGPWIGERLELRTETLTKERGGKEWGLRAIGAEGTASQLASPSNSTPSVQWAAHGSRRGPHCLRLSIPLPLARWLSMILAALHQTRLPLASLLDSTPSDPLATHGSGGAIATSSYHYTVGF
jgi:hypothetical protein